MTPTRVPPASREWSLFDQGDQRNQDGPPDPGLEPALATPIDAAVQPASSALERDAVQHRPEPATLVNATALAAALAEDAYWGRAFAAAEARAAGLHLAIFTEPYLGYLLDGRKTIESRFTMHRAPPFGCVEPGDIVLVKAPAGPVIGIAGVSHVWQYRLTPDAWTEIRLRFGPALCLEDDTFLAARQRRRFATLLRLTDVRALRAPAPILGARATPETRDRAVSWD